MTSALRASDLAPLRSALTILLSPLDEPSPSAWRRRASGALQTLLSADGAAIVLQLPGEPTSIGVGQWGEHARAAVDVFTDSYFGRNPVDVRRRRARARVWTRSAFWPITERERSSYFNEWCRPNWNFDSVGMSALNTPYLAGEAAALITADRPDRFAPGGREEQLLTLLQPAFAAAVTMLSLAGSWREMLGTALDAAGVPLAIVRPDGVLLHATPALLTMVAADHQGSALLAATQAQARDLGRIVGTRAGLPVPARTLETPRGRYDLRATLIHASHLGAGRLVLVAVTSAAMDLPLRNDLRRRFRLTPREAEIALLLARGARDRAVAAGLGIRLSTVRHHVEHILMKLDVHARAAVSARIREP